jgi:hypothetical protein
MVVVPLISSTSSSSRSTRMRNLKNAISTLGVNQFSFSSNISSKAAQNGSGFFANVFNISDCDYPEFRDYRDGGNESGLFFYCRYSRSEAFLKYYNIYGLSDKVIFSGCEQQLTLSDIIWYGELNDPVATSKNKIAGNTQGRNWNWSIQNIMDMRTISEKTNNGINKYICGADGIKLNPNYKD